MSSDAIIQIAFAGINVVMVFFHEHLRLKSLKQNKDKAIFHGWWMALYFGLMALAGLFTGYDWHFVWLSVCNCLIRGVIFTPLLNFVTTPRLPLFYYSKKSTAIYNQVVKDRQLLAWILWLVLLITLNIFVL